MLNVETFIYTVETHWEQECPVDSDRQIISLIRSSQVIKYIPSFGTWMCLTLFCPFHCMHIWHFGLIVLPKKRLESSGEHEWAFKINMFVLIVYKWDFWPAGGARGKVRCSPKILIYWICTANVKEVWPLVFEITFRPKCQWKGNWPHSDIWSMGPNLRVRTPQGVTRKPSKTRYFCYIFLLFLWNPGYLHIFACLKILQTIQI